MNRLIKQLTDMGFPVCENIMVNFLFQQIFLLSKILLFNWTLNVSVQKSMKMHTVKQFLKASVSHLLQRDPAEEALKCNNMNLDQAMSKQPSVFFKCRHVSIVTLLLFYKHLYFPCAGALLEKKMDLDKRGMGMSDYSNGMNKPIVCRPSALSKDPSDRAFLDKVRHYSSRPFLNIWLWFCV